MYLLFFIFVLSNHFHALDEVDESGKICEACLKYILRLHDYLIERIVDPFESYVSEAVCRKLPQSLAQTCLDNVQAEADKLREQINLTFDNERFCAEKVCYYTVLHYPFSSRGFAKQIMILTGGILRFLSQMLSINICYILYFSSYQKKFERKVTDSLRLSIIIII